MKKFGIANNITRSINKAGLKLRKHSPEILLVTGIVAGVTSAVMACKATTKLSGILEENKENVKQLHEYVETHGYSEKYTEEDSKKDLAVMYTQTGLKVAKLYAPSVLTGAAAIACILGGYNIINKRYVSAAAAYATIDSSFKAYRNRVIERFGKELDRELKYDIKTKQVEETVVNEDGTETVVTKTVQTANLNGPSDYAKFFDESCPAWDKDPDYNFMFVKGIQSQANDMLQARGHLFLNEVYDMLGIPRTQAGNIVGWIYDEEHPMGDNFVDFGIFDQDDERKRMFVNGHERTILLDFNVDGNIWELLN